MRTLLASDAPRATFAVEVFVVYRIGRKLGWLAAAHVGRRDTIERIRALAAERLGSLGGR